MGRTAHCFTGLMFVAHLSGCLFTTDLERFEQSDNGSTDCDNPRNVCFRLTGFQDRAAEIVRADLITNGRLRARAIYKPIEADGDVETILPLAISRAELEDQAVFEVQITTDADGNGEIVPEVDHTFSLALPERGNLIIPESDDAPFDVPEASPGDFTMSFTGMTAHRDQLIEVWVQEEASGSTVGYYRLAQGPESGDFDVSIPGIIGAKDTRYRVQFYADFDASGGYAIRGNNTLGDHSWVRTVTAVDGGASLTFDHTPVFEDLIDIPASYGF